MQKTNESTEPKPATVTSASVNKTKKKKKKNVAVQQNKKLDVGSAVAKEKSSVNPAGKQPENSKIPQSNSAKRKLNDAEATSMESNKYVKKRKFDNQPKNSAKSNDLTDNRLKAFGINPKKFKNKIKYNHKSQPGSAGSAHKTNKKNFKKKKTNS